MPLETDVLQHLLVGGVQVDGEQVLVDVYGSSECVCGSIRFSFPEADERKRQLRILHRWLRDDTPVTYVARGEQVSLVDEQSLFADLGDLGDLSAGGPGADDTDNGTTDDLSAG